jgi:hypothetical protein
LARLACMPRKGISKARETTFSVSEVQRLLPSFWPLSPVFRPIPPLLATQRKYEVNTTSNRS